MDEVLKSLAKTFSELPTRAEFIQSFKIAMDVISRAIVDMNRRMDARLAQVKNVRDGKDGAKGDRGERGPEGKQGKTFIALRGEQGPQGETGPAGSPDTAEQVRDKLETLKDEERLDAAFIKNLPAFVEKNRDFIGPLALSFLMDVYVPGIIAGQSLQWDGVKWIAFTPSGSGGTPVFGEVLQTQSPTGTSFTIAHSPQAGSVRLFRGGAYQSVSNGDYTLSGTTITLSTALQSGETLVVDYNY